MWAQWFQLWGVCATLTEVIQAHGSLRPGLMVPAPHTDLWGPKGIRQQSARRWAGGPPLTRHPGSSQDPLDDGVQQAGIRAPRRAASVLGDSGVQALPASTHPLQGWGQGGHWAIVSCGFSPLFRGRQPICGDIMQKLEAPGYSPCTNIKNP